MKQNVDLTEDQLFWNHFFESYTFHGSSYLQMFCFDECFPEVFTYEVRGRTCKQVNRCTAVMDEIRGFAKGDSLIATGNSLLREVKFLVRERHNNELCEECDKPVRIPWNDRLCSACMNLYKEYERQRKSYTTVPWSYYYSSISGIRSIPWLRRF